MPRSGIDFNHVIVYVRDVRKSLHFYEKLLHFKVIEKYDHDYVRLRSPKGRTTIALHKASQISPSKRKDIVLYFEARKLDEMCNELAHDGVRFSQMPKMMPWGWKHAYLEDPDGHEISLYWAGKKRFEKTR